jgi:hypothetical protein
LNLLDLKFLKILTDGDYCVFRNVTPYNRVLLYKLQENFAVSIFRVENYFLELKDFQCANVAYSDLPIVCYFLKFEGFIVITVDITVFWT